jgi:hypothetical protein
LATWTGIVRTHVLATAFVAELLIAKMALDVVTTLTLLLDVWAVQTGALLHQTLLDKSFEFLISSPLLTFFAYMAKRVVTPSNPAFVKAAALATKLVFDSAAHSFAVRFYAVLYIGCCPDSSIQRICE